MRAVIDDKGWPTTPNYVTRRLNKIRSNLLEGLNIEVTVGRITTGDTKGRSVITVRKIPSLPSLSSPKQKKLDGSEASEASEDTFQSEGDNTSMEAQN